MVSEKKSMWSFCHSQLHGWKNTNHCSDPHDFSRQAYNFFYGFFFFSLTVNEISFIFLICHDNDICQDHRIQYKQIMLNKYHPLSKFQVILLTACEEFMTPWKFVLQYEKRTPLHWSHKTASFFHVSKTCECCCNTTQQDTKKRVQAKHTEVVLPCSVQPCSWVYQRPDCPALGSQPEARQEEGSTIPQVLRVTDWTSLE